MSYVHLRMFWGAIDLDAGDASYDSGSRVSGGTSASVADGGVALRRATLVFDPDPPGTFTDDVRLMHFDWMNYTGGTPDDTWTTGDFTTLEALLATWWTDVKPYVSSILTLREIRWYRVGTGVAPPNPAERVHAVGVAGTSGAAPLPPQVALSITNKTAVRKRWGRTYLPELTAGALTAGGACDSSVCSAVGTATDALYGGGVAADFLPMVYSPTTHGAFAVESVQVDDVFDVIRSRRWRHATFKYHTP